MNDSQKLKQQIVTLRQEILIESALEKVRKIAMAMKQPADMLRICKSISQQLQKLGINEIRNVQTAIFYPGKRTYMNYEYYARHDKFITTETTYANNKIHAAFAAKMLKGKGAFFVTSIKGNKIKDWLAYQKTTNVFIDKYLNKATSLNYYWYSLGPVALGISTYEPLSKDEQELFVRFRNVFELAYRRFLDIQKAEAQVKEAQIEAALERVRSRTMAMHQTSELQEVIHKVHQELLNLQLSIDGGSFVVINKDIGPELRCWGSGGTANTSEEVQVPHFNMPFCTNLMAGIKKGPGFFTEEFSQKEKKEYFTKLFKQKPWSDLSNDQKKATLSSPGGYTRSVAVSKHTSIFIINHQGRKFTAAEDEILKRFAKVFEQTYTRFLDLQKAEAQAREAQIQLALERVRARTMAMQHSFELSETASIVFQQLVVLGLDPNRSFICTFKNEAKQIEMWATTENGKKLSRPYFIDVTKLNVFEKVVADWKLKKQSFVVDLQGKALENYLCYLRDELNIPFIKGQKRRVMTAAFFSNGYIGMSSPEPQDEEIIQLLQRFASAFDLTYTRFLDLQKAEAQAREAQIEASLEKVRSRSLAMHQSNEIKEVVKTVFEKMKELGFFQNNSVMIVLPKIGFKDVIHWTFNENFETMEYNVPAFNHRVSRNSYEAWARGDKTCELKLDKKEKDDFLDQIFTYTDYSKVPDKFKKFLYSTEAYSSFIVFEDHCGVLVDTFSPANYNEDQRDIVKRFAKVFEQAYIRFLDLQKAEAQAREAQIEAALEKVRSRSLAMRHSNELEEVVGSLFDRLLELGLSFDGALIFTFDKQKNDITLWIATNHLSAPALIFLPYDEEFKHNQILKDLWSLIEKGEYTFSKSYSGKTKNEYFRYTVKHNESKIPSSIRLIQQQATSWSLHCCSEKYSIVGFDSWSGHVCKDEDILILKRFAKVFDQAYVRFLDLQKAEAQAREAQIEAALEKVRSASLAMHKSDELREVVAVVFDKLKELGFSMEDGAAIISIFEEHSNNYIQWIADPSGAYPASFTIPATTHSFSKDFFAAREKGLDFFSKAYTVEEKNAYFSYLFEHTDYKQLPDEAKKAILESQNFRSCWVFEKNSAILIPSSTGKLVTEDQQQILKRIIKVFEQCYIRFLDLQKAEVQAREAQIEAALERVRSRSLAMHKSEELKEVIRVVLAQFIHLNIKAEHAGFYIDYKAHDDMHIWLADPNLEPFYAVIPYFDTPTWNSFLEAKAKGIPLHTDLLDFETKNKFYQSLFNLFTIPEAAKEFYMQCKGLAVSTVLLDTVGLYIENFGGTPYTDEENQILMRFGKAFQQAYTRFLDLQRAEKQAREAQIEAALERVRSRTMAMHSSAELLPAAELLFDQVQQLGAQLQGVAFAICDKDSNMVQKWTSIGVFSVPYTIEPGEQRMYEAWKNQIGMYEEVYEGERQKKYYETFMEIPEFRQGLQKFIDRGYPLPTWQKNHAVTFKHGYLLFITTKPFEETQIFLRFGKVFEQTYTRFLDLQKAEAQAREARIEAALEKVRSRTLAMQKSDELAETAAVLFQQLILLGIEPNRLYIAIIKDDTGDAEFWITDEDGSKVSSAFKTNLNDNITFLKMLDGWKKQKKSLVIDMQGKELKDYFNYLGTLHVPFKGGLQQKRRVQHIAYFSKGFIGMASPEEQTDETTQLLERFAAVFNLTFTRFNDLKIAEAHALQAEQDLNEIKAARKKAEDALEDLQATQKQLIQAEKMASLGELTAGIAHEIQNPLNFVNNFSEVSSELISEMVEEAEKGNTEEVKTIAVDLKGNLEKINYHGQRAAAIVKGMLLHSRSSSGTKESTNINALCDEYLRLAYHGLRAKDKSFNAKFETDFDDTVEEINIIPQEIGRVILNLINNAFYAVNEKAKQKIPGYEPTVMVGTKKNNGKVEIKVADNGGGIPQKVLEKIFQPFFTTKPTGQGTGLGLSLSYDIIKAHGGEIKVGTKEGEGSEFIIQLPVN